MLGQKVKELTIPSNKETEVQLHMPPGIYFITAIMKNNIVTSRLVVD